MTLISNRSDLDSRRVLSGKRLFKEASLVTLCASPIIETLNILVAYAATSHLDEIAKVNWT